MIPFARIVKYGNKPDGNKIVKISSGTYHMMLLDSTDTLWGTGAGAYNALGTSIDYYGKWTMVASDVADVWCASNWTFMKKKDGTIWYTGTNGISQTTVSSFTRLTSAQLGSVLESDIKDIYGTDNMVHVVLNNRRVYAIGANTFNNSGISAAALTTMTLVSALPTTTTIKNIKYCSSSSNGTAFVLFDDSSLYGAGRNSNGELGRGNTTLQNTFVRLRTGVQMIATGGSAASIMTDSLYSAGQQFYGQLGNGAPNTGSTNISTFTFVPFSSSTVEPFRVIGYSNQTLTNCFINTDGIWYTGNSSYAFGAPDKTLVLSYTNIASPVAVDDIVGYGAIYDSSYISSESELYQCGSGRYVIGNGVNGTTQFGYIKVKLPWD